MTTIDIIEETLVRESSGLLRILLKDRTTNKSIVWATHSYELLGKGFGVYDRITPTRVTGDYANLIQPRSEKSKYEQKDRTKIRAEVFTPTWLVKEQVDTVDQDFQDLDLEAYLQIKWLEITCGEAPYMVSRYDAVTGQALSLEERVGFLDRKLHRLSKEVYDEEKWFKGAVTAYQNSYGYEFQGDSLLLARENLFASFIDYYQAKFAQEPSPSQKQTVARIISYNVLQMDGLTYTVPYSEEARDTVQLSLFEEIKTQTSQSQKAQIKDWKTNELIDFERLSQGEPPMKFDVVIGNPPYQEELEGTSDKPIYNYFMDESYKIGDKSILITPARFLFNAGKTPKAWNQKMLADEHLKVSYYKQDSSKVFSGTDIKGGVAITYHDNTQTFGAIGTFTAFDELNGILHKVTHSKEFESIIPIIFLQNKFKLDAVYTDFPELRNVIGSAGKEKRLTTSIFSQDKLFKELRNGDDDLKILGLINNKRHYKYIKNKYIEEHANLMKYKVLLPKSNGSGSIGEVLSTPLVGTPLVGITQSFISFGCFDKSEDAEACLKYIKTKFCRALLGTLKITQDNNKDTWKNVPLQDFTSSSDIDWSQSVAEIDAQLYKKYGLSQEEIDFIESKVKAMD